MKNKIILIFICISILPVYSSLQTGTNKQKTCYINSFFAYLTQANLPTELQNIVLDYLDADYQVCGLVHEVKSENGGNPQQIAQLPNSDLITIAGGALMVWHLDSAKTYKNIKKFGQYDHHFIIVSDNVVVVTINGGRFAVCNLDTEEISFSANHDSWGYPVGLNDGIVYAVKDNSIKMCDLMSGKLKKNFVGHNKSPEVIKALPNNLLASAGWDPEIKIWDLATGDNILNLAGHKSLVNRLEFLIKNELTYLLSVSHDNTVKMWDLKSGTLINTIDKSPNRVSRLIVLPNNLIAIYNEYNQINKLYIVDPFTGKDIQELPELEINNFAAMANGDIKGSIKIDGLEKIITLSTLAQRIKNYRE